ncbi:MAG: Twitching motility family [Planctomycetota bacterium]|nr:MAG: Twitching motility family [Planctomycetota bacterium]
MIGPNDLAEAGNTADLPHKSGSDLGKLIVSLVKNQASDFRLMSGKRPIFRIATVPHEVGNRPLTHEEVKRIVRDVLDERRAEQHDVEQDLSFVYSIPEWGRFLVNTFHDPAQPGTIAVSVRTL